MSTSSEPVLDFRLVSPDGRELKVPKDMFEALAWVLASRKSGQVCLHVKSGAIASVSLEKIFWGA